MQAGDWSTLPPAAQVLARGVSDAVAAAAAHDPAALGEAARRLAETDPEHVRVVRGAVVRSLLEDLHPAGLAREDMARLLEQSARDAAGWWPQVDAAALLVVLTGALGIVAEAERPVALREVASHGSLLVAHLVALVGGGPAPYLRAALAEVARAETVELP